MVYAVKLSREAIKFLEYIDTELYLRIKISISKLSENPRPPGCIKLKGKSFYRIKIGEYRIIYDIQDDLLMVYVLRIAHRSKAYRNFKS